MIKPALLLLACGIATNAAARQGPPTYGLDFVTVGNPGNRAANRSEVDYLYDNYRIGDVGYSYQIMRTNLTVGQWSEFVSAYAPFYTPRNAGDWMPLTGFQINRETNSQGQSTFSIRPGADNYAAQVTWEMAARYCNWLQNDKVATRDSFERGVYDTSTFGRVPGTFALTHQLTPSPGARYWIPTWDEMAKATYYDPNRYGEGVEGYWQYPNRSDNFLRVGLPEDGGETIGDLTNQMGRSFNEWDVRQYLNTHSYYGLLDVSGTVPSWTTGQFPALNALLLYGSDAGGPLGPVHDRLDSPHEGSPESLAGSIRIVSIVPAPTVASVVVVTGIFTGRSRRRDCK